MLRLPRLKDVTNQLFTTSLGKCMSLFSSKGKSYCSAVTALEILLSFLIAAVLVNPAVSAAESKAEMTKEARQALNDLYVSSPSSKVLAQQAKGILVFPSIVKGGFLAGGQYGEGVLFKAGKVAGYYNTASISYGLQAGLQKFGYALFFMNDSDLKYLGKSDGWEIGVGPSVTIVDQGVAKSLTTTTAREGVFAFFFDQRGLMAGLGLQGTKISQMDPKA